MKKNYLIILMLLFIITGWGQEKKSSLVIHVTKENLEALNNAHPDKEADDITDQEKSSEEEEPEYLINFNPVLHYSNENDHQDIVRQLGAISKATIFTIYRSADKAVERGIWEVYGEESHIKLTTQRAFNSDRDSRYKGGNKDVPVLNTYTQFYSPKNKDSTSSKQRMLIGGSSIENVLPFQGEIAEVIVHNKVLKTKQREKIESTLALKYGVTLNNGKNYIASDATVIWNTEEQETFTHRIAGIGRDDDAGLYQKQSHNTSDPGFLTIGAGEITASNEKNTTTLENDSFLIWGDNNQPLILESDQEIQNRITLLHRRWLMQLTGDNASEISTHIQLNVASLFGQIREAERYLLVIDESGTGDFLHENIRYIYASSILESNIVSFEDVQWDSDGSGSDVFSFTMLSDLDAELTAKTPASCDQLHNGILEYMITGGVAPYTYELSSGETSYNEQWESTDGSYPDSQISHLAQANYSLMVTDAFGQQIATEYYLENPVPINIDLGSDRRLTTDEPLYLDASFAHPEGTTYQWTSDNGFSSTSGSIYIDKPGTYQVTATSPLGCTASDEIIISDRFVQLFSLYPNHSEDGNYRIQLFLEESSDVSVSVFDSTGRLITSMQGKNETFHELSGHISTGAGIYTIVIETNGETISRKLIIE